MHFSWKDLKILYFDWNVIEIDPKGDMGNKEALAQVMAWHISDKSYLNQFPMVTLFMP